MTDHLYKQCTPETACVALHEWSPFSVKRDLLGFSTKVLRKCCGMKPVYSVPQWFSTCFQACAPRLPGNASRYDPQPCITCPAPFLPAFAFAVYKPQL